MIGEMDITLDEVDCLSALRRALRRRDFRLERFSLESVSESPVGFMARHLTLVATVEIEGATREVRFFVKSPPTSGQHLAYLEEMQHFGKELDMYDTVVPAMSAALPEGLSLPVPRCFLTRGREMAGAKAAGGVRGGTSATELIILEDLRERGYRLWDKMVPFDWEHCRWLMKSLACFHAPSLILQKAAMRGGKGDNYDYVDGTFRVARDRLLAGSGGEMGSLWAETSVGTMATAVAGLWPERFGGVEERRELGERLQEARRELSELSKPSRNHTNVLCHGDLWANNVMFRYEGEEKGPAGAMLVDLQLVRFAPAATDLLLFFHTSTTKGFRTEHMDDLLRIYHRHLREIVGEASSLDELMPQGSLVDCVEEYGLFGKMVSSIWLSFILNSEDVVPMMEGGGLAGEPPDFVSKILKDRGDEVLANARASEAYKTRMMESYRECLEHLGLWR